MRLRTIKRDMRRVVAPVMNPAAKSLREVLKRGISGTPQGSALFGGARGRGGALGKLKIKPVALRVSRSEGAWIAGGKLNGFGAWIASKSGGQTRAHKIVPKKAKGLVFKGRSGFVFAREVNHPGARVKGYDLASKELRKQKSRFPRLVLKSLERWYSQTVAR